MSNKTIKIIKRTERELLQKEQEESSQPVARNSVSDIVETVKTWVSETRKRKREERGETVRQFFPKAI